MYNAGDGPALDDPDVDVVVVGSGEQPSQEFSSRPAAQQQLSFCQDVMTVVSNER